MQKIDKQPSYVKGILAATLLLAGGYLYLPTVSERNVWSVLYLWQRAGYTTVDRLPSANALGQWLLKPPASHGNAAVWQARAALQTGNLNQASLLVAPAVAAGNEDAQRLQGEIAEARGDFASAMVSWQKIGDVDAIAAAASRAAQRKQLNHALLGYRTAYELSPESYVLPLAHFLWQLDNNAASAESILTQYIAAYPTSRYYAAWLRELGSLYRTQKAWDKAAAISAQLLAVAPDSGQDWIDRGWIYYGRGDGLQTALAQFQQAIALDPNRGEGYFAIASLLTREKSYDEADRWYAQALAHNQTNSAWYLARGQAAQDAGQLTLAIQVYAEAQQRFPKAPQVHYQAAWAYKLGNQPRAALAATEALLSLLDVNDASQRTSNAAYYARAGQIYEWTGAPDKAVAAYAQAQQLDAQNQAAQDGVSRLQGN